VEQISGEIRTISHLLHPPLLDEIGWARLCTGTSRICGTQQDQNSARNTQGFGPPADGHGDRDFPHRAECLTNIHRHSGSKTASIRVIREITGSLFWLKTAAKAFQRRNCRPLRKAAGVSAFEAWPSASAI